MKKLFKALSCVLCAAVSVSWLAACADVGKRTVIAEAADSEMMSYLERNDEKFTDIVSKANAFSAALSDAVISKEGYAENIALAPVSVFMALSMAAECAGGEARQQIYNALGVDGEDISDGFGYLYRALNEQYETGKIVMSDSVWLQEGVEFIRDCVDSLAEKYYCSSYGADFKGDNVNANKAVRSYVRDRTEGLIDQDFRLSEDALFVLVNALYVKDSWDRYGDELPLTSKDYVFTREDGSTVTEKLMEGGYSGGVAQRGENFTTFYSSSTHGYRLHFILPDDGCALEDVFNEESINFVSSIKDYGLEGEDGTNHFTRALFPQFSAEYNDKIDDTLKETFGITDIFDKNITSFTSVIEDGRYLGYPVYCAKVLHVAKLNVERRGFEGAAVTVISVDGATSADPSEKVYHDFIVDRAFGYVLCDRNGVILFSGVVNDI